MTSPDDNATTLYAMAAALEAKSATRFGGIEDGLKTLLNLVQPMTLKMDAMQEAMKSCVTQEQLTSSLESSFEKQMAYCDEQIQRLRQELTQSAAGSGVHHTQARPMKRRAQDVSDTSTTDDSMGTSSNISHNPQRLWFVGFPRKLLAGTLRAWAEAVVVPLLSQADWASCKLRVFNAQQNFPSTLPLVFMRRTS